ncbi:hypothetical protein NH340_JMT05199 [Sarcoptes scabiei]|nr:hypothetical protein NH340_JMT05199 [Sarcoptes scabiei]
MFHNKSFLIALISVMIVKQARTANDCDRIIQDGISDCLRKYAPTNHENPCCAYRRFRACTDGLHSGLRTLGSLTKCSRSKLSKANLNSMIDSVTGTTLSDCKDAKEVCRLTPRKKTKKSVKQRRKLSQNNQRAAIDLSDSGSDVGDRISALLNSRSSSSSLSSSLSSLSPLASSSSPSLSSLSPLASLDSLQRSFSSILQPKSQTKPTRNGGLFSGILHSDQKSSNAIETLLNPILRVSQQSPTSSLFKRTNALPSLPSIL